MRLYTKTHIALDAEEQQAVNKVNALIDEIRVKTKGTEIEDCECCPFGSLCGTMLSEDCPLFA